MYTAWLDTLRTPSTFVGLVALAACGDGIAGPDALAPDDDETRGVVEVRVLAFDPSRPAHVYFQERDSTLALATRLDGDGVARGYLRPHGFVTVVPEVVGGVTPLYTYANVSPGDELVIDPGQSQKGGAQLRIRIPAYSDTEFYTLESPCGVTDISTATAMSILVDVSGCGAQTDLLVVAHAPGGDAFFFENDVALDATTPVVLALSDRQYRPFEPTTARVLGVPAQAERWVVGKGTSLGANLVHFASDAVDVVDGSASFATLAPFVPEITAYLSAGPASEDDTRGLETVIDWRPAAASISLDLRDHDLRDQSAPMRYVPDASSIGWSEAASGLRPQITIARMQWVTPETLYQWTILGQRGDEARLEVPVLPRPELAPDPRSPPYDMFRIFVAKDGLPAVSGLLGWTPRDRWPVAGQAGTVVWQALAQ